MPVSANAVAENIKLNTNIKIIDIIRFIALIPFWCIRYFFLACSSLNLEKMDGRQLNHLFLRLKVQDAFYFLAISYSLWPRFARIY